jgi:VCBS repeat-containing protein
MRSRGVARVRQIVLIVAMLVNLVPTSVLPVAAQQGDAAPIWACTEQGDPALRPVADQKDCDDTERAVNLNDAQDPIAVCVRTSDQAILLRSTTDSSQPDDCDPRKIPGDAPTKLCLRSDGDLGLCGDGAEPDVVVPPRSHSPAPDDKERSRDRDADAPDEKGSSRNRDSAAADDKGASRNRPPTAADDRGAGFGTDENTAFTTDSVLENDSDQDGDRLTIVQVRTGPTKGRVTDNGDGTFDYDPDGQFEDLAEGESDTDRFTYTVADRDGGESTATVVIRIEGVDDKERSRERDSAAADDEGSSRNRDSEAADDKGATRNRPPAATEDKERPIAANDRNAEASESKERPTAAEDKERPTAADDRSPAPEDKGSTRNRPPATASDKERPTTTDKERLTATDDQSPAPGDEERPRNRPPAAADDKERTTAADNTERTTAAEDKGSTRNRDAAAPDDTRRPTATDDQASVPDDKGSSRKPPPIPAADTGRPTAVDDEFTTAEDTPFTTGDLRDNDSLAAGEPLTIVEVRTGPTKGTVTDNGDGTFDYDPDGKFAGLAQGESDTDRFTYTVSDGTGGTDTATVTIRIDGVSDSPATGVNGSPDAVDDGATTDEQATTTIDVLANDTDSDQADVLTVTAIDTTGTKGQVTDNGDGTFDYDPTGQFETLVEGKSARDRFAYRVSDGNGGTDTARVTIAITGVNDSPDVDIVDGTGATPAPQPDGASQTLSAAASTGAAVIAPVEMTFACALNSNGLLRYVTGLNQCKSTETKVTIKPGPVLVCVQSDGSVRKTSNLTSCNPPNASFGLTLPPATGSVNFCAAKSTGVLRYVTALSQCKSNETPVFVTPADAPPADAPPAVTTTVPANSAANVAVNTNIVVNFNESVTVSTSSFTLTCGGNAKTFTLSGSPGQAITLDPAADLPQGTGCTVTAIANSISDTDTLDPPDHPAANSAFSFTTLDAALTVSSTSPANDATDVNPSDNITVTFSKPVNATTGSFTIECPTSGNLQDFNVSGSGTSTITLDPTANLPGATTCTVTVLASGISDADTVDPPDLMTDDYPFSFKTKANTAPVLAGIEDGALAYAEGDEPKAITVAVTVADVDSPRLSGATVQITGNYQTGQDVLAFPGVTGITSITGSFDTVTGTLTLSGSDTLANYQSALRAVTYANTSHSPNTSATRTVTFIVDDGAAENNQSNAVTRDIAVTPANDAPTDITLDTNTVAENAAVGTAVGTLSATDPDASATHTFALVAGTGDDDNTSFQIGGTSGDKLQTKAVFDFETRDTYSVRIQTDDGTGSTFATAFAIGTGGTFEEIFPITITDANDPPDAVDDKATTGERRRPPSTSWPTTPTPTSTP